MTSASEVDRGCGRAPFDIAGKRLEATTQKTSDTELGSEDRLKEAPGSLKGG
jgi:hypothetical protein